MIANKFGWLSDHTLALSEILIQRHTNTADHSSRVGVLCEDFGALCGFDQNEIARLKLSGSLHDIGKVSIPDNVLLKPTGFTAQEWAIMKSHADLGGKIFGASKLEGSDEIAGIIRHHHESFDGSGYPDALAGEDIPICSRIIALIDTYDAMAEVRPYRGAIPHDEIMRVINDQVGRRYDPYLWSKFMPCISSHPMRAP